MNNRHKWRFNVHQKLMEPQSVIYLEFIRKAVMHLPLVTEKPCYGTPGFYVNKKLFCRLREDCETLAVYNPRRDEWMDANPLVFFITDHYLNTDYMLVSLQQVQPDDLAALLSNAWRSRAPAKIAESYHDVSDQ